MKKAIPLFFVSLLAVITLHAQKYEWVETLGATNSDGGRSIITDAKGNVYILGQFIGTVDFDPGAGTANLTSVGNSDVFIQKMDPNGNLLWVKSFGGVSYDYPGSLTIDGIGNIYTTGSFQGTVDFDPGVGKYNLTSAGGLDVFVHKMDSSGNFIWARVFGDTLQDSGLSITTDAAGNVYTTGAFGGTVDFNPGVGALSYTASGNLDVFIQKLSSTGNFLWAKAFGGISFERGTAIRIDGQGNIITAGRFKGTVDFNPGTASFNLTSASTHSNDIFIQKLNSFGNFVWAKAIGGQRSESLNSMALDSFGNIYSTGWFAGTVDFDPWGGGAYHTSIGSQTRDIFVMKMSSAGSYLWVRVMGAKLTDEGISLALDNSYNIYTAGNFWGTVDFDPGLGTTNLTAPLNGALFVQKLNSSGNFVWAKSYGGQLGSVSAGAITLYNSGNVYTTGSFQGTSDFNPGTGTDNRTSSGSWDIYIHKLGTCPVITGTDTISACDSYTWIDGITYTSSNYTATYDTISYAGCDSAVSLYLTINHSSSGVDTVTACGSYTWINGNTYTTSTNTAKDTLTNAAGCDSILTLNLTIDHPHSVIDTINACSSYTWIDGVTYTTSNYSARDTLTSFAGCDSVVSLHLTINHPNTGVDTVTACDSYIWIDGKTYTSSNYTAKDTLTNTTGCDSVVTLNLTINHSSSGVDTVTACGSYTWIDGNTYTTSTKTAKDTLTNVTGCDSVVTLNLTINPANSGTDTVMACDSYTWINGKTYTASNNTAKDTLTNVTGCDSVVTLNLTINPANSGTDTVMACDSYTWINGKTYAASNNTAKDTLTNVTGCDSVVTLHLTINYSGSSMDTITACDSYTWINGKTYTASNNTAKDTLTNATGCDSVVTLNLTLNHSNAGTDTISACNPYTWIDGITYTASNSTATYTMTNAAGCDSVVRLDLTIDTVNVSVTQNGASLTADETSAAYQWLGCQAITPIPGAIHQSYTPAADGDYAVEVTVRGCTDTSICYTVTGVGILENDFENELQLYPNPTDGKFTIDLGHVHSAISVTVRDLNGKTVQTNAFEDSRIVNLSLKEPSGVYLLMIESGQKKAVIRLVLE